MIYKPHDYQQFAIDYILSHSVAALIEKFFKGKLYAAITNIDGEFLIDKLRKEAA